MKKLMSILLATVMCVTCGGIDCSAARAKAFSRRTHHKSSNSSSNNVSNSSGNNSTQTSNDCCKSEKPEVVVVNNSVVPDTRVYKKKPEVVVVNKIEQERPYSSFWDSWSSNRKPEKPEVVVVNNNVAQNKSASEEKPKVVAVNKDNRKHKQNRPMVIVREKDSNNSGVVLSALKYIGGILLASLASVAAYCYGHAAGNASGYNSGYNVAKTEWYKNGYDLGYDLGYDKGLGDYKQENEDYENCLHKWENLKREVLDHLAPEKFKHLKNAVVSDIYNKFESYDEECMTEEKDFTLNKI